jgi:hypothetical protein
MVTHNHEYIAYNRGGHCTALHCWQLIYVCSLISTASPHHISYSFATARHHPGVVSRRTSSVVVGFRLQQIHRFRSFDIHVRNFKSSSLMRWPKAGLQLLHQPYVRYPSSLWSLRWHKGPNALTPDLATMVRIYCEQNRTTLPSNLHSYKWKCVLASHQLLFTQVCLQFVILIRHLTASKHFAQAWCE